MKNIFWGLTIIAFAWIFSNLNNEALAAYIYVDGSSNPETSDGTESNPYSSISEALEKAQVRTPNDRQIFVKAGTYNEHFTLPDNAQLIGENVDTTIIDLGDSGSYYITMGNKTRLERLTVKNGRYGVVIPKNKKVTVKNCEIKDSRQIGIWVRRGKSNSKVVEISDSKIKDSKGKGAFIQARKIVFANNLVTGNKEEGLDIRSKVKGSVKDSEFKDNKESGIELEIRRVNLKIRNNKLSNNGTNGICLNNRTKKGGNIDLIDNSIKNNDHFGIRCAGTRRWSLKLWKRTVDLRGSNPEYNDQGDISASCVYTKIP